MGGGGPFMSWAGPRHAAAEATMIVNQGHTKYIVAS